MCLYGPLYEQHAVGRSETYLVTCCTATRNQTFSGGEEKLLFSCANFVDQTMTPNVNADILTFIIAVHTHVTIKSGA